MKQPKETYTLTYEQIIEGYKMTAGAHTYAIGFELNKMLYVACLTFEELSAFFKNDRASKSKGGYKKIRIRLSAAQRKALALTSKVLGNFEELIEYKDSYTRGDHFEKILKEQWQGETWKKDSTPYWKQGDIRVNGVEIQVKLDGAELNNENTVGKRLHELGII